MTASLVIPENDLTPELQVKLLQGASSGLFKESVAEACGIKPERLDMWLTMGLSPGAPEPYRTFAKLYVAAEAGGQLPYIEAWRQAAQVDWRAAQAWLAARHPNQWGRDAVATKQAGDLQPTDADAEAEEAMVRALIRNRPPKLLKILAEELGVSLEPEQAPPAATPPKRPG